jgi:carbonic anhydrase/acetyltransferase-like protein (isoleucine patch superfamily)
MIRAYKDIDPQIDPTAFVAPGAWVIGRVVLARDSSVFYNSVVRGDTDTITIGERTNIQDNCTLHVNSGDPLFFGSDVTVGHNAVVHGCTVHDRVMIGMGAIVLDRAVIESGCIVAAGSLVPPGKVYKAGSMIMGSPARVVRELSAGEIDSIVRTAAHYVQLKDSYR